MKNRLPKIQEIIPVYAVISFMIYGWTFILFFWKLPSWLDFMNIPEIFGAFSYGLLTNTIESLIVISGILFICMILPPRFLRDSFIARGTIITIISLGSMMLYQYQYRAARQNFSTDMPIWLLVAVIVILLVIFLTERFNPLKTILMDISDRLIIFLYIFVPLSIIAILDVILRNLA
jgi:hypothetical protein